jgi:arylsulfatase A-like enzyme
MGAGLASASLSTAGNPANKPNILFIMSDDHTSQAVGAYGGRLQKLDPTPVIDTLAKEGVLMENAFCSNAICTPSRACIMTGQYSAVNGVTDLGGKLPPEQQYLAIEMKKAGYQTAVIGKWHLKQRPEAFDYYKVFNLQGEYFNPMFFETGATGTVEKGHGKKKRKFKGAVQMKGHSSDCVADSALEWFKEKRDPNQPFFLKLQFKAPHDMFEYAPRYESYLADVEIPEPENLWERGNHGSIATRGHNDELLPYIGTSIGRRNIRRNYTKSGAWAQRGKAYEGLDDETAKRRAYQDYLKAYLRCVKGVDDNLKRVFDYMKAEGIFDNTVVITTLSTSVGAMRRACVCRSLFAIPSPLRPVRVPMRLLKMSIILP